MKQADNPRRMTSGPYVYYNHWLNKETEAFNVWWFTQYGKPEVFGAEDLESDAADHYYT
jgi:hypothetical protein